MMTLKRICELEKMIATLNANPRSAWVTKERLLIALRDAVAEIKELRNHQDEIASLHRDMCLLAADRLGEINTLRAKIGDAPIPSHYEPEE